MNVATSFAASRRMTTRDAGTLKPAVLRAVEEIRAQFAGNEIETWADPDGGVFVRVHGVDLGETYEPRFGWVGFRITFQYPQADIYPHYLPGNLRRRDGRALGEAMHANHAFHPTGGSPEVAVMVSRKSNRLNAATDTAVLKLLKVIDWIRSR